MKGISIDFKKKHTSPTIKQVNNPFQKVCPAEDLREDTFIFGDESRQNGFIIFVLDPCSDLPEIIDNIDPNNKSGRFYVQEAFFKISYSGLSTSKTYLASLICRTGYKEVTFNIYPAPDFSNKEDCLLYGKMLCTVPCGPDNSYAGLRPF